MKHPLTTTNTVLSTPPSGRLFCKLLTPNANQFGLTKVNKMRQQVENQHLFVHVFATIQVINRHFVNRHPAKHPIFAFCPPTPQNDNKYSGL
jgi:hypothetical protein